MRESRNLVSHGAAVAYLASAAVITCMSLTAHGAPAPGHSTAPSGDPPVESVLRIGPVAGLTEAWHVAPRRTAIPVGTVVTFWINAPENATVKWSGAVEILRIASVSVAVCPLVKLGPQQVSVTVLAGAQSYRQDSHLDVVDVSPSEVFVASLGVAATRLEIDGSLPPDELNELTVDLFFGPSIAPVRETGPGQFRTSVGRPVEMTVTTVPEGFAPLMEWRVDGEPQALGGTIAQKLGTVGTHVLSVGPPAAEQSIEVETYAVEITSHEPDGLIPQGVPVTFTAVTDPSGYENEITWLAATKFGFTSVVLGYGAQFTCTFEDTFGRHPDDGEPWQWMGVKAANALLGQDQKGAIQLALCAGCDPAIIQWTKWIILDVIDGSECGPNIFIDKAICTRSCPPPAVGTQTVFQVNGSACIFLAEVTVSGCDDCLELSLDNLWEEVP